MNQLNLQHPLVGRISPDEGEAACLTLPHVKNAKVGEFARKMAADYDLKETFAPGVYMREILMPAGDIVFGHRHLTEHANVVIEGEVLVSMDGIVQRVVAPATFISKPGVRKVLYIVRDCRWLTIHPTDERDPAKLRAMLITESDAFIESQMREEAAKLQSHAK